MNTDLGGVTRRTGNDASDDPGPTLLYLVGRLDGVVHRAIRDAIRDHGLSVGQYTALSVLGHRSGLSNAQLARRSLVSPQSAHELLLALENGAWCDAAPMPTTVGSSRPASRRRVVASWRRATGRSEMSRSVW